MMLRAGLWIFTGKLGNQAINLVLVIILARLLTPEAFGVVAVTQALLSLSEVVVRFGIGTALVQTAKLTPRLERTAQTLMLSFGIVLSGAILAISSPLSSALNIPELTQVLPVVVITFIFSCASNISVSLISREMDFKFLTIVGMSAFLLGYGLVSLVLAFMGFSYWSIIIGALIGTTLRTLMCVFKKPVWPTLDIRFSELLPLLQFGGGVFLVQILAAIAQRADSFIVTATMGPASLGFYSRAYSLMELSNGLLGSVFHETLFTGFSKQRREGWSQTGKGEAFLQAHSFATLIISPIAIITFMLPTEIILVLLGPQWDAAAPVLQVFALGMIFRLGYKVSGAFNLAQGIVYRSAIRNGLHAGMVSIAAYVGSNWGLTGVAAGVLLALAFHFVSLTSMAMIHCNVTWGQFSYAVYPYLIAAFVALLGSTAAKLLSVKFLDGGAFLVAVVVVVLVIFLYFGVLFGLLRHPSVSHMAAHLGIFRRSFFTSDRRT